MLKVENICVKYNKKIAIENASFEVNDGEIIGLIGADGAGKSSLLHSIAGIKQFQGKITYNNTIYTTPKQIESIKSQIGLMPQGLGLVLYDSLSIKEHFDFFRNIKNVKQDKEYENKLLNMAGLSEFQDRLAKNLSGGMRQKLSLILTLLNKPKLLILDEPTTGVDPISRLELWEIIDNIRKKENIIALISTAYMQEAELMDKVMLFDEGEIIAQGYVKDLLHKSNSLEELFFANAIQKNKNLAKINLEPKIQNIPNIIIEAKKLTKKFGTFKANDKVDLELKKGEILGLLGANGAGKTTFIKMLLGLYPIDEGELFLLDKKINSYKDRLTLKSEIGYVSQKFALYSDMTIKENMQYFAKMHNLSKEKIKEKIKFFSNLLEFKKYLDFYPKDVPLGINQRFSLSVALLHEPKILFLDEPTSGVDTIARASFWNLLKELKEKWEISILITTHYMNEAEYCDRVVVLKSGKKIIDNSIKNLHSKFPNQSFENIFIKFYNEN